MAEKILKASRRGSLGQTAGFGTLILNTLEASPLANDVDILPIRQELELPCRQLNEYANRQRELTRLGDLDELRDNATRKFYLFCIGQCQHPDENIAAAAQKFLELFGEHELSVLRFSYTKQDSFTEYLLNHSAQQEYVDAITLLHGGSELLAQLATAQENFNAQRIAAGYKNGNELPGKKGTALKNQILSAINDMLVHFLRYAIRAHGDKYVELANTIRELIKKFNVAVKLGHQPKKEDTVDGQE